MHRWVAQVEGWPFYPEKTFCSHIIRDQIDNQYTDTPENRKHLVPLVLNSEKYLFLTVSHVMITISGHECFRFLSRIQLCFVCIRRYKIFPLCAHPYIRKLKRFRNSLRVFIFTIGLERWKQEAKKRRQTEEQNSTVCFPRQLCFCLLSVALHFFTWNSKFKDTIEWYHSQQHSVARWRRKSFRKYNRITKDGK